jgi:hypothetical protein
LSTYALRFSAGATVAFLACAFARPPSAFAQGNAVRLDWVAPANCPKGESIVAQTDRMLRGSPALEHPIEAHARVRRDGDAWHLRLETTTSEGRGRRDLTAASCAELADTTAIILALMVDPNAAVPERSERRAKAPPDDASSSQPSSSRLSPTIAAAFRLDAGTMPSIALGIGIAAGASYGPLRLDAGASYWPSRDILRSERPFWGATLDLWAFDVRGCFRFLDSRTSLSGCIGAEIDRMGARGFGGPTAGSAWAAWFAPSTGALVTFRILKGFSIEAAADVVVPTARPRFVIAGLGELHEPGPVAGRGGLGLSAVF